jgi:hypothetical protein
MAAIPYNVPSIEVTVNGVVWNRMTDFYDETSALNMGQNGYMLLYDKYKRYVIAFSTSRSVPAVSDTISVRLVETLGTNGKISALTFVSGGTYGSNSDTLVSIVRGATTLPCPIDDGTGQQSLYYSISNPSSSYGGNDPEEIEALKEYGKWAANSQLRNVTISDYIGALEEVGDISRGSAWGEKEQNPAQNIPANFNKVYLAAIPYYNEITETWDDTVIGTAASAIVNQEFLGLTPSGTTLVFPAIVAPETAIYKAAFTTNTSAMLEPRKIPGTWEEFVVPEFVYFRLDIGVKVKRGYQFQSVADEIKSKLIYWFLPSRRKFGETIDFREIENYLRDYTEQSPSKSFPLVRGVNSLIIRDVLTYNTNQASPTYIDNGEVGSYPKYIYVDSGKSSGQVGSYNLLMPIQVGSNQFPVLAKDFCVFSSEA